MARFNEKYPKEQFRISETDSAQVVEQVLNRTIDIGFTGTVLEKKHCVYIPFYEDELIIITPNNERYRKLCGDGIITNWIADEPLIMREEGSGTRKEAEKQLRKSGIDVSSLNVVASIENQEAIKRSVENGMGVSIISRLAAQKDIENGLLLGFDLPAGDRVRNINIVYNKGIRLSGATERFIRTVREVYCE